MFLFSRKNVLREVPYQKFRGKNSPEVTAAKEYLNKTHPTLLPRESSIAGLVGHQPFYYVGCSKKDSYTRYHFCEGSDDRIIYIVLCDEEREKIIKLFTDKMKEMAQNYQGEFIYKDSLKGMFVGKDVKHRFYSNRRRAIALMSDDGEINFPPILEGEDME